MEISRLRLGLRAWAFFKKSRLSLLIINAEKIKKSNIHDRASFFWPYFNAQPEVVGYGPRKYLS